MAPELKNSIKELYTTFEKNRSNSNMNGSPNYDDLLEWNKELFSKKLIELNEDDLSRFVGKAITTWGSINDYKHFLPRIFELTAELKAPYDIWIVFDKLIIAEWYNWSENEQKVIHKFMIALWIDIVNNNSEKAESHFIDYFSAIAHFYPNFSELLTIWGQSESKGAIKHLANYIVDNFSSIYNKNIVLEFGNSFDDIHKINTFIEWLISNDTIEKLQRKYFEYESEYFSEKISWAEQILRTTIKK